MSHQLLLVLLMIAFAVAYSKVEPDDLQASKLIGEKSYHTIFYRLVSSIPHFRLALLLRWRFLLRQSADKASTCHQNEKHGGSPSTDHNCIIFRDAPVVHLWIPYR